MVTRGFGILLMSFLRTHGRPGRPLGGRHTDGDVGRADADRRPKRAPAFEKFTLVLPQGWAMRGWRLTLAGGSPPILWCPCWCWPSWVRPCLRRAAWCSGAGSSRRVRCVSLTWP